MGTTRTMEILVGAFMALGFVALFFLAMRVSNLSAAGAGDGYALIARFDNVGSLKVRAPVSMAGVRLGRVESIGFDAQTYQAVVTLRIEPAYDQIPTDTFANIYTAGLLGEQYVALDPGGSPDYLTNGDQIEHTQSALVLERMIGQFLFNQAQEGAQ
ncbi:outer membrane lipid asymmetry maintenance protein MlaD [uncultured Thiohalocapsa sp.]|uniref:outer membrane lipid asymmetry maintenance protein MlaD n=1 Tax=uncultured Thiohalocapsa sp. TaxID=768990 RepID=UPI0025F5B483|nr:outer membrane lipid asymmetry maintenance protein MlaD [uncultured Thiohalocapsa sp.]